MGAGSIRGSRGKAGNKLFPLFCSSAMKESVSIGDGKLHISNLSNVYLCLNSV